MNYKLLLAGFVLCSLSMNAQIQYPHISTASTYYEKAERGASFGVSDAPNDVLEITNATKFSENYIPAIWARRESDNRHSLQITGAITSFNDNGTIPVIIFSTDVRDTWYPNAPSSGDFPWGNSSGSISAPVQNRPLFSFRNASTPILTLSGQNNMGLGTESPTVKLDVVSATANTSGLRLRNLTTASPVTAGSKALGVDASENVVIADVSTGGSTTAWSYLGNAGTDPATNFLGTTDNKGLAFRTNNTEKMRITETGNVGIGTNAPMVKFHLVSGTANTSGMRLGNLSSTTPVTLGSKALGIDSVGNVVVAENPDWSYLGNSGTDPAANFLGTTDNKGLAFRTNNTEQMRLSEQGVLGIGTQSYPSNGVTSDRLKYRLFVKDGIRAEKVKVDIATSNAWADYVFKKDYVLPSLEEVERHIAEKGHLRNIPSSAEVQREGLNLGEMDAKLLEKIEELTLYSIELNKKNKEQELFMKEQSALLRLLQERLDRLERSLK